MKKTMKKLAAVLLSVTMLAGMLTGCGDKPNTDSIPTPTATEYPAQPTNAPEATATPVPELTDVDPAFTVDPSEDAAAPDLKKLNALEVVELMGNGINLGNTMEAYGRTSFGAKNDVSLYETFWGQPVTTQAMLDGMKAAGFDSIRIPIAWTNAMDFESGDYTIGEAYLNRIDEIIVFHKLTKEEMKQIEEWTGKKCSEIIFDSDKDNWDVNTSDFDAKIMNKSHLVFVIEDEENNSIKWGMKL